MNKYLIAILVVAVLSYGAWLFWGSITHEQSLSGDKLANSYQTASSNWFEIPEWGVKFKNATMTADLQYDYDRITDKVNFTVKRLADKYSSCKASGTGLSRGLARFTRIDLDSGKSITPIAEIGGYIYYITSGGAGCVDDIQDQASSDVFSEARQALAEQLKTLKSSNK